MIVSFRKWVWWLTKRKTKWNSSAVWWVDGIAGSGKHLHICPNASDFIIFLFHSGSLLHFYSIESVTGRFNYVYYSFLCVCASVVFCFVFAFFHRACNWIASHADESLTHTIERLRWPAIMAVATKNNFDGDWSEFTCYVVRCAYSGSHWKKLWNTFNAWHSRICRCKIPPMQYATQLIMQ